MAEEEVWSAAPAAGTGIGATSSAGLLAHSSVLDDFKTVASELVVKPKKAKMHHNLFFDDDLGFKKILDTFPKIRFRGKGHEFDDLGLMLRHYSKWMRELHPSTESMEDLVLKARDVLQTEERTEEGVSEPRKRLQLLRSRYKNKPRDTGKSGSSGGPAVPNAALDEETRRRIAANRQRALEKQRQKHGPASSQQVQDGAACQELDMEQLWAIEENRKKALERQKKRKQQAMNEGASQTPIPQAHNRPTTADDEDDVFGFGCGLDDDECNYEAVPHNAGGTVMAAASNASMTKPSLEVANTNGPTDFDDEHDVFGFSELGMDMTDMSLKKQSDTETQKQGQDADGACQVADNCEKAVALKKNHAEAHHDTPGREHVGSMSQVDNTLAEDFDDDVFGFGGGLDEP